MTAVVATTYSTGQSSWLDRNRRAEISAKVLPPTNITRVVVFFSAFLETKMTHNISSVVCEPVQIRNIPCYA